MYACVDIPGVAWLGADVRNSCVVFSGVSVVSDGMLVSHLHEKTSFQVLGAFGV